MYRRSAGRLCAGLRRYRLVLTAPGVRAPLAMSVLGSLPLGMYVLGVLLLARESTGSFGDAGRVAGAFGLGNAVGAVAQGRLMDRHGQPRVLRPVAAVHAAAVAALVLTAQAHAPTVVLALCAAAGGWCLPQLPAAMRSLWPALIADDDQRQTAYATGAVAFELAVVSAPAIVAGLVVVASAATAVAIAAAIATGAALAFSTTAAARAWRGSPRADAWLGPLVTPGMRTLFGTVAAMGAAVGTLQVAVPAFTAEHGSAELGGMLLAAMSAGSLLGGLLYGMRSWPGPAGQRLSILLGGLAAGCCLLLGARSVAVLAVILIAVGLLLAPITIVASALLDSVAPSGTVTEAFSVMVMGVVAGTAVGSALGGTLVDVASYGAAAGAAAAVSACGAAFAIGRRRTLARQP